MLIYQNRDEKYVAQYQFLKILTLNMCFCVLLESALAHPHVDRINISTKWFHKILTEVDTVKAPIVNLLQFKSLYDNELLTHAKIRPVSLDFKEACDLPGSKENVIDYFYGILLSLFWNKN